MSEVDSVKEEIGFFKTLLSIIITTLFAVVAWFVGYEQQDVKSGFALVAIVVLIVAWLIIQSMIFKLIRKLKEL
jgi:hypothetical protein